MRIQKPNIMKNLKFLLALTAVVTFMVSCTKDDPIVGNPATSYYYSMKGEKLTEMQVEFYHVFESEDGTCAGLFVKPTNEKFDFIIEVGWGLPENLSNNPDLEEMQFMVDVEFTGVAYNCTSAYKRPANYGDGNPEEIQQVKIIKLVELGI